MWSLSPDLLVLALALVLDLAGREPPSALHPTVWMGRTVDAAQKFAPRTRAAGIIAGAILALAVTGLWTAAAYFAAEGLRSAHGLAYILAGAVLLKTTFSVKLLHQVAAQVRDLLIRGEIGEVRSRMSSLVSRDPSQLTSEQATAATVESVSENMVDSFIGPWLAFALFGLPGAVAYRAVSTLDSMIGYRGEYEYLGKASARLDDLLNLVPSRLTGLMLVLASMVMPGQSPWGAWRIMWRDHGRTESPNAGWPMSSMAGALGVELEKGGHYRLGDHTRPLAPSDITQAVRSMYLVAASGFLVAFGIILLKTGLI